MINAFKRNFYQVNPESFGGDTQSIVLNEPIETENGTLFIQKKITAKDYADSLNLPTSSEYSLKNLLASGVPLREVSVSGLLDSYDPADPNSFTIGQDATEYLNNEINNSNQSENSN